MYEFLILIACHPSIQNTQNTNRIPGIRKIYEASTPSASYDSFFVAMKDMALMGF